MSKKPETRKAIYFDLNTVIIKEYKMRRQYVYSCIEKYMLCKGFEHPQYSVYESKEPMSKTKALRILRALNNENPWLSVFMSNIRISNIEVRHDLTHIFTSNAGNIKDIMLKLLSENKQPTAEFIKGLLETDNTESVNTHAAFCGTTK